MELDPLITALHTQGLLLGDAADRAGLAAPVPTCPGWTVRDLLLHIGGVHRWAATIVGERRETPLDLDQPHDVEAELPTDDALLDWYRAGHAHLVHTLSAAPVDLACWAFLPAPSPLAFWARRQAHETTVHRVDADRATGPGTSAPIDAELADDGIDELLTCFVSGRNRRLRAPTDRTLHVHATDVDTHWLVRIGADLPKAERVVGTEPADMTVTGPAELLYLALWHRLPWDGLTVTGGAAEVWSAGVHVRWS
ncbi:MAG TPA: maleylpyruvate isomerase family mycothiol-dependent enzyme [Pseudonocardiaceae bacterium]